MTLRDLLAQSTRHFARLVTFDLECPHCGEVYVIRWKGSKAGKWRARRYPRDPNWDPETARFTCTRCMRVYVLGILSWPIGSTPKVASSPPRDQVPSPRQLASLRKEGGGWWLPDEVRQKWQKPYTTNLTLEDERPEDANEEE